jgi:hypothetical protein
MLNRNLVIFIAAGDQNEVNVRSASIYLIRPFRLHVFYVRERLQNGNKSVAGVLFVRFLHNLRPDAPGLVYETWGDGLFAGFLQEADD